MIDVAQWKLLGEPTQEAGTEALYVLLLEPAEVFGHVTSGLLDGPRSRTRTTGPFGVPTYSIWKLGTPPLPSAHTIWVGCPFFQLADVVGLSNCCTFSVAVMVPVPSFDMLAAMMSARGSLAGVCVPVTTTSPVGSVTDDVLA